MSTNINFSVNPIETPEGPRFEVYASCGDIWDSLIVDDLNEESRQKIHDFTDAFARREDVKNSDYWLDLTGTQGHETCNIDRLINEVASEASYGLYETDFIDGRPTLVAVNPEFQGEFVVPDGVEAIGEVAFEGCDSVTSVTLPDSVEVIAMEPLQTGYPAVILIGQEIAVNAFSNCDNLQTITFNGSVSNIEDFEYEYGGHIQVISSDAVGLDDNELYDDSEFNCNDYRGNDDSYYGDDDER